MLSPDLLEQYAMGIQKARLGGLGVGQDRARGMPAANTEIVPE